MWLREVAKNQHVLLGLLHQLGGLGETLRQGAGQVVPAFHQTCGVPLGKHRAQCSGDHALVSLWDALEQVAGEMNAAALPAAALVHAPDRLGETEVCVPDHQLDPSEATLLLLRRSLRLEGANESLPKALAFAVTNL